MTTMEHSMQTDMKMDEKDGYMLDNSMSMMQMTFYVGVSNVTILFKGWTVNSAGGMVGACFAVCVVAMLYEGLKVLRENLLQRSVQYTRVDLANEGSGDSLVETPPEIRNSICSHSHWLQTFLHLVQVTMSYALMLIFMTYNAYLAISVIVGAGLGYFIFGWKKAVIVDPNDHCH